MDRTFEKDKGARRSRLDCSHARAVMRPEARVTGSVRNGVQYCAPELLRRAE